MMSPNEYDVMVEHLASEIIDDVMEKEAYSVEEWAKMTPAQQNKIMKQGQKALDVKNSGVGISPVTGKRVKPMTAKQKAKYIARANSGVVPKSDYGTMRKKVGDTYGESATGRFINGARIKAHDAILRAVHGGNPDGRKMNAFDKAMLIAAGTAAAGGAAAAGIHAYKNRKAKEEEQKEKTAFYYDDALEKMAAAQNVWDMADEYEDSYETMLMKQAAEDAYEEAMAQAEAAENVYDAIEAGAFDSDYDDEDYYDYE